jgi:N-acetylneuraminic acid mutarotase
LKHLRRVSLALTLAAVLAGCGSLLLPGAVRQMPNGLGARNASWQAYPDMPSAHDHAAATPVGLQLVVLGGGDGQRVQADVESFRAFDTWSDLPAMPTARMDLSAVMVPASRVLAIGGRQGTNALNTVELYSMDKKVWNRQPAMPTARWGAGAAADGLLVYVAGGTDGSAPLSTVEKFDAREATGAWSTLPSLSVAREGAVVVRLGRRLFAIGGRTTSGMTGAVEKYDVDNGGNWVPAAPMPTARAYAAYAVYGNHVFVLGGQTANGETDVVESYDLVSNTWVTREPLPMPLSGAIAAKLGERLVVTGGSSAGQMNRKTWGRPFPFGTLK